jgi:hypothetical protein
LKVLQGLKKKEAVAALLAALETAAAAVAVAGEAAVVVEVVTGWKELSVERCRCLGVCWTWKALIGANSRRPAAGPIFRRIPRTATMMHQISVPMKKTTSCRVESATLCSRCW